MMDSLAALEAQLAPARARLLAHPIYAAVASEARLRCFMAHHVFAVWDFMSILKALQLRLTSVAVPWLPTADSRARRLVNEIVLVEESDDDGRGGTSSHFELYVAAMDDLGADTTAVRALCSSLAAGRPLGDALAAPAIPAPARAFMATTFDVLRTAGTAELAATFAFGREDVIPDMFRRLVTGLSAIAPDRFERLRFYLDRHIVVDDDEHGPAARRLLAELCGTDATRWASATRVAQRAIEARVALWDGVAAAIARAA